MSTLIFDFDGTIADSLPIALDIFRNLTHSKIIDQAEIIRLRQLPLKDAARELNIKTWRIPLLLWRGRKMMKKRARELKVFTGMPAIIRQLHEQGNQLFIMSSNDSQTIKNFLKEHKLNNYFTQIYGGVGLFAKAKSLRAIIRKNHLQTADSYYLGDEIRDIEAAKIAGIKAIAVAWGYNDEAVLKVYRPDILVTAPAGVLQSFKKR